MLSPGEAMKVSSWHVSVAAEAFAAGLFARCGCDVSVQYGADQPEYDLIIARGDKLLKVSVKGSQDGSWGLTQRYLRKAQADYVEAIERWVARHKDRTILCLVQFRGVDLLDLPRMYLATPIDIGNRLRQTANGRGDTILYEQHSWGPRAFAAGTIERIPEEWRFSEARLAQLLAAASCEAPNPGPAPGGYAASESQ